jgi:hypothetical protein
MESSGVAGQLDMASGGRQTIFFDLRGNEVSMNGVSLLNGVTMKLFFNLVLAFALWSIPACASANSQMSTPSPVPPQGSEILGVFQGNTPCSAQARPLPQIPSDADCEQMIWSLVLYQDPQTKAPTTYQLNSAYGLPKQGTNDLVGGGTPISMEGKWTIMTGTKPDPDAIVYQINPDDPQTTVSFLKVNENLLHVLSSEKTLLVGNGAWSYTLNRMDNQSRTQLADPSSFPEPPTRPPMPPMPEGSSVFGVFDGRTPCHELVVEFTQFPSSPGCLKIKWRLTLYQDAATSAPSTYLYMGTSTYREGSWEIVHDMEGDPDASIYQLNLDDGQPPVSFLRVDENHLYLLDRDVNLLVGNELFSYTLSRVDPDIQ